ncbi:hypothetical protein [Nonomuraea basaltis]|uniref:hypothetical protein n=1 Tax=Nonomuraea basaltis TaxID=2495887 RepID=UPI00110C5B55|nr:hypothetical protein [Nonomuraea basaltis]TMR95600.1 hypothetical protein EJK15_27990 [Nonomuraea basaltis]
MSFPKLPSCPPWCASLHATPGTAHFRNLDLVEMLDDPNRLVEINLYAADDGTPPLMQILYPGDVGTEHVFVSNEVAGAIATIVRMFEGPGLNDRRGLREFAQLLDEGAHMISGVTEL